MKITIHGAGQEVGRSCIEVEHAETRILLDAGLKLEKNVITHPKIPEQIEKIDAVILSHAHLDHCGSLPLFHHQGLTCPVYMTPATQALAHILLQDSFEIELLEKKHPIYNKQDIERIMQQATLCNEHTEYTLKDVTFQFFNAGHIPGSATIYLTLGDTHILYTGDINTGETQLMSAAETDFPPVDVLICESTYGDRNHPDREKTEQDFVQTVKQRIENGSVLLPTFAVGRAQEIVLLLAQKKIDYPVYVDGMARRVTHAIFNFPSTIKNSNALRTAYAQIDEVHGFHERQKILTERGVFITTSGMLDGGPVIDYLKHLHTRQDASLLLTGFQAEGSNGRLLLQKKQVLIDNVRRDVQCAVKQFDLSAHAGQDGLKKLIAMIRPKILIVLHGDSQAIAHLAGYAMTLRIKVYTPNNGDQIIINQ